MFPSRNNNNNNNSIPRLSHVTRIYRPIGADSINSLRIWVRICALKKLLFLIFWYSFIYTPFGFEATPPWPLILPQNTVHHLFLCFLLCINIQSSCFYPEYKPFTIFQRFTRVLVDSFSPSDDMFPGSHLPNDQIGGGARSGCLPEGQVELRGSIAVPTYR